MKILMIDIGGTSVKMMASGHEGFRKFPSGEKLTAAGMVRLVRKATHDWEFDAVTLGYPGIVARGAPAREPVNLGGGWVGFDYAKAFRCPVQIVNDAAMQALGSYHAGRMLFIGLGTSVGSALIADDTLIPIEIGVLRLTKKRSFGDDLGDAALVERGRKQWEAAVWKVVSYLREVFWPDEVVIGGGNAKQLKTMPEGCRRRDNKDAFRGAQRLWPGADMLAEVQTTTWRIKRPAHRPSAR